MGRTLVFAKSYLEIGGSGGPAGATGAGGGTEAVTAWGGAVGAAEGPDAPAVGSGVPLETAVGAAGEACGAGVIGGTGSGRSAGGSPLPVCFGASVLAASDLLSPGALVPSPEGLAPSDLPPSSLAASLLGA